MKRIAFAAVFAALTGWAGVSNATISVEAAGLSSADQTIDFESASLTPNFPVTTEFSSLGVTFLGAYGNPDPSSLYANISGNRIGNYQSNGGFSPLFLMSFATDLNQAAFSMVTAPGGASTFQALLDGVVVETATFETTFTNYVNFFTFTGIVFDAISISVALTPDHAFLLDNLQTVTAIAAPVPEPETWALLLAGLWATGEVARRRRSARCGQ